ncbi:MAG: phage terminase large subunit, partial [Planctomycetes bacterium]|nr:phage terminase large subunit [Planctomycetota bacterium]
ADTACFTGERHDFSVFQLWAILVDGRIALLDQERGKYEAPELQANFQSFCERFEFQAGVNNMGVRTRKVENKMSGIGLIQAINTIKGIDWIEGIPRDKDKVSRAKSAAPEIKKGKVLLPRKPWIPEYIQEFHKFNSMMTHKHDDQIDPTLDAIHDNIIDRPMIGYANVVGGR